MKIFTHPRVEVVIDGSQPVLYFKGCIVGFSNSTYLDISALSHQIFGGSRPQEKERLDSTRDQHLCRGGIEGFLVYKRNPFC